MNLRPLISHLNPVATPGDTLLAKWRVGDAVRSFEVDGRLPYGAKVCERVSRELRKAGLDISKREVERCARFAREYTEENVEALIREGVSWRDLRNPPHVSQFKTGDLKEATPSIGSKPVRCVESWREDDYEAFRGCLRAQPCIVCGQVGDIRLKSWPWRNGERWQVVPVCGECQSGWTHVTETKVIRSIMWRDAEIVCDKKKIAKCLSV
jgi:hypothetical protein